eukprot:14233431-Heterocapsa_arctica.AAC.1
MSETIRPSEARFRFMPGMIRAVNWIPSGRAMAVRELRSTTPLAVERSTPCPEVSALRITLAVRLS